MSKKSEDQPRFIDPNSGAASQPGGFVSSMVGTEAPAGSDTPAVPDNDPQAAARAEGTEVGNTPDMAPIEESKKGEPEVSTEGGDGGNEEPKGDPEPEPEPEPEAKDYTKLLDKNIPEVVKFLEKHPEEKDAVIEAEKAGKARAGIVDS